MDLQVEGRPFRAHILSGTDDAADYGGVRSPTDERARTEYAALARDVRRAADQPTVTRLAEDLRSAARRLGIPLTAAALAPVAPDDQSPETLPYLALTGTLAVGAGGDVQLYSRLYKPVAALPKRWDESQPAKVWREYLEKRGMPFKQEELDAISGDA
jgi:hypothetical protein